MRLLVKKVDDRKWNKEEENKYKKTNKTKTEKQEAGMENKIEIRKLVAVNLKAR